MSLRSMTAAEWISFAKPHSSSPLVELAKSCTYATELVDRITSAEDLYYFLLYSGKPLHELMLGVSHALASQLNTWPLFVGSVVIPVCERQEGRTPLWLCTKFARALADHTTMADPEEHAMRMLISSAIGRDLTGGCIAINNVLALKRDAARLQALRAKLGNEQAQFTDLWLDPFAPKGSETRRELFAAIDFVGDLAVKAANEEMLGLMRVHCFPLHVFVLLAE